MTSRSGPDEGGEDRVQEMLPELTRLAEATATFYGLLQSDEAQRDAMVRADLEFILRELLAVCALADHSDEVGRRLLLDCIGKPKLAP